MIIPGANGLISLTIPIIGGRDIKIPYKDVLIDHSGEWMRDHYRTIISVYGKSAWGIQYFDSLEFLYAKKEKFLLDWNLMCLEWICSKLKISLEIVEDNEITEFNEILQLTDRILPSNFSKDTNPIKYFQVFEDRFGFQSNMSSIDLLMNEGPSGTSKFL